jgi:hypothetical protein
LTLEKQDFEQENERILISAFAAFLFATLIFVAILLYPGDAESSEQDVALWLARSCVGEAGWDSYSTGECAALMHVYLKRSRIGNLTLLEATRKYSGATKKRRNHPRKWLFGLDRSDSEPEGWPQHLSWSQYSDQWLNMVDHADAFLDGLVADPMPEADHYGSIYDHHRAVRMGWWEMKTDFRNRFYSVDKPNGRSTKLR